MDETARVAQCVECGCATDAGWKGWRAYRIDDPETAEPPNIAFYCPACALREFGRRKPRSRDQG